MKTSAIWMAGLLAACAARGAEFRGWEAEELTWDPVRVTVVPALGRAMEYSAWGRESLLRVDDWLAGKNPSDTEGFFNAGGEWLWPVAQERWGELRGDGKNWPPPEVLGETAWAVERLDDGGVRLSREYGAPVNVRAEREFHATWGGVKVRQRLMRTAGSELPVTLWNVAQVAHPEEGVLPGIGELSTLAGELEEGEMTTTLLGRVYAVREGREVKLGTRGKPWAEARKGGWALRLEAEAANRSGTAPDGGCTAEIYSNEGLGYMEIETLSPEVVLKPGETLENTVILRYMPVKGAKPRL